MLFVFRRSVAGGLGIRLAHVGALPTIAVEAELAGDSRMMFRLRVNGKVVGEKLTAAQAHLLVGSFLERIVLPNKATAPMRETSARWERAA